MDGRKTEGECKQMYSIENVRLDASIIQTMVQDCGFDDEYYEHVDKEMRRYHPDVIRFSQTTTDVWNDVSIQMILILQLKQANVIYPIEMKFSPECDS